MSESETAQIMAYFLDTVGLHDAARIIKEKVLSSHSGRWGCSGAVFTVEDKAEPDFVTEARLKTQEWCAAKKRNVRPVRQQDLSNPSVAEGREAALDWLRRKAKSAIKK
jgi:hypothetical protein